MAIKEKNQPAVGAPAASTAAGTPERQFKYNEAVDARLSKFMEANPDITQSCTQLVKQYPERAIRSLALREMFRQEDMARRIDRQMPQVQQWVKEHPGLEQQIESKIRTTNPLKRMAAFISEAVMAKGRIEFSPPKVTPSVRSGMSV